MNAVESTEKDRLPGVSPWLASLMLRRGGGMLSRFAQFYQRLAAQPRPWRRRLQRKLAVTLTGAALLLALAGPTAYLGAAGQDSPAAVITVADGQVEIAADGQCSLIEAIVNANDDAATHPDCAAGSGADTIQLPPGGTFTLIQAYDDQYNGLPPITGAVTIEGNGATIDGPGWYPDGPGFRMLQVTASGDLTLRNVTVDGGSLGYTYEVVNGAGVFNAGHLTLDHAAITGSVSFTGTGGIHNTGSLTMTGSSVSGNTGYSRSPWGPPTVGGIVNEGHATISDSQVDGNYAVHGAGGIHNSGDMTIADTVLHNRGYYGVGGILNEGDLTISDSSMVGDKACYIQSINNYGNLTISNSTISGSAWDWDCTGSLRGRLERLPAADTDWSGQGTVVNSGRLVLENVTVADNYVIYDAAIANAGRLVLDRTIVSGNVGYCYDADYNSYDCEKNIAGWGTVIANGFNVFGSAGDAGVRGFRPGIRDVIPDEPLDDVIRPLGYNGGRFLTHALPPGSPAIDLGPTILCAAAPIGGVDQRDLPRNVDGDGVPDDKECDAGAIEAQLPELENAILLTTIAPGVTVDGLAFHKTDILKWNGTTWSRFFDGRTAGLPGTADIAAISVPAAVEPNVYLAFVNSVRLPGMGFVRPQDIVRWDGTGFSLFFDGSDAGLTGWGERIDALEILPRPDRGIATLLISTTGAGRVEGVEYDGTPVPIEFRGEDVLDIDVTQAGQTTLGKWRLHWRSNTESRYGPLLDGSLEGVPANATFSLAQSAQGTGRLYLTSRGPFAVDEATGTHSMVYGTRPGSDWPEDEYEYWFSGPYFSAADHGLRQKVDGLEVLGDLP